MGWSTKMITVVVSGSGSDGGYFFSFKFRIMQYNTEKLFRDVRVAK